MNEHILIVIIGVLMLALFLAILFLKGSLSHLTPRVSNH